MRSPLSRASTLSALHLLFLTCLFLKTHTQDATETGGSSVTESSGETNGTFKTLLPENDAIVSPPPAQNGSIEPPPPVEARAAAEAACKGVKEVVDPCPELSINGTPSAQQLSGAWQVLFGYVRALTTRAFCPRLAFVPVQGPCLAFSWTSHHSRTTHAADPLPADGPLRLTPHAPLLAPLQQGDPVLKLLQLQEPFAVVAVCSSAGGPRRILGLGRAPASPAANATPAPTPTPGALSLPGTTAAAISFWASVHASMQRAGGPAWYLCARAWGGDDADDGTADEGSWDFTTGNVPDATR